MTNTMAITIRVVKPTDEEEFDLELLIKKDESGLRVDEGEQRRGQARLERRPAAVTSRETAMTEMK